MSTLEILILVFGIAVSIAFVGAGASKITGQPAMRATAESFSIPWPRYRAIGVLEILIAAGIVAGLWVGPVGIVAGLVGAVLMAGALTYHVRFGDPAGAMGPAAAVLVFSVGYTVVQILYL